MNMFWKPARACGHYRQMVTRGPLQNLLTSREHWLSCLAFHFLPLGPAIALVSPWTKDTIETMKSIPRVYPCKLFLSFTFFWQSASQSWKSCDEFCKLKGKFSTELTWFDLAPVGRGLFCFEVLRRGAYSGSGTYFFFEINSDFPKRYKFTG